MDVTMQPSHLMQELDRDCNTADRVLGLHDSSERAVPQQAADMI